MPKLLPTSLVAVRPIVRATGWLLRDLAPWLVQGLVGWLTMVVRKADTGPALCNRCPFRPDASAATTSIGSSPAAIGGPAAGDDSRPVPAGAQSTWPGLTVGAFGTAGALALLFATGCGPTADYLSADRATYAAIAPDYAAYVQADAQLSPAQVQRRLRTIDTWRLRLDSAAGATSAP